MEKINTAYDILYWYNISERFEEDLKQMQVVACEQKGGSYEWDDAYVFWHTGHERFYYLAGSGCSCNSITDGVYSLGDFMDYPTKEDVIRAIKQDHPTDSWGWSQRDIDSMVNDVRNWRK